MTIVCETVYELSPGTRLTGTNSTLKPTINGAFLRVTEVSPKVVKLKGKTLTARSSEFP